MAKTRNPTTRKDQDMSADRTQFDATVKRNAEADHHHANEVVKNLALPTDVMFKFFSNDTGNPTGKLADAEMFFTAGPLVGLKLVGFAVWERRGGSRNVTFPARSYAVNGERRTFSLLRPSVDMWDQERLRDMILTAYTAFEIEYASIS